MSGKLNPQAIITPGLNPPGNTLQTALWSGYDLSYGLMLVVKVHKLPRKLRILWPVLLLFHDSITVTLCCTKSLTKTSTNCNEFRIMQHELSVESFDGNKMLGSYVTICTGYLFTLGRILNWQLCVLNHTSCDNRIIWQ